ncbi:MAG TPA: hypothetical protein DD381_01680 [Lentisphaeria bacterium]|nr:MAG: hypothetical protein A2X47_10350 [Lentisphaerae bacterium GWF2_38_69]HBM15052.1 hypothetical protein [Lentisphaeria bacterium]
MKLTNKFVSSALLASAIVISGCATKKAPAPIVKIEQPKLTIAREVPQSTKLNAEYIYTLKVTNNSDYKIDDAVVRENLPSNFDVIKVNPPTEERGRVLIWNLGIMVPGQTEIITITGKSTTVGKINYSGSSTASFNMKPMLVFTEIVSPELAASATGPEEVLVGETFPVSVLVKNTGTSTITGITLPVNFPDGIATANGEKQINLSAEDLKVGQSTVIPLELTASKRGKYVNEFVVASADGVKAKAVYSVVAKQPKLDFKASVPAVRYVGNSITYKLEVQNTGNGQARKFEANLALPAELEFVSANEGGKFENDAVIWDFKDFLPNETKTFTAKVISNEIRLIKATAQVSANNAEAQRIPLSTDVQGIPAISIDLSDVNDPIALGEIEDYSIKISNQGSLAATNLVVTCLLEDSMQAVKASGGQVDTAISDPMKLVFKPISSLGVNQTITLHAFIKAVKPGDTRFTVSVICDQLERPVSRNESTTFYKE